MVYIQGDTSCCRGSNGVILRLAREGCDPEDQWVTAFTTKFDPKDPHYRKTRLPWVFLCTHTLYTHAWWHPYTIICIIKMCSTLHTKIRKSQWYHYESKPLRFMRLQKQSAWTLLKSVTNASWTQAPLKGCIDCSVHDYSDIPRESRVSRDPRVLFKRLFHRKTLK